ncbi:MAG: TPM domain-containing protein [Lachnospiraceae bacterium]|nr:TPM domain-containing protein [Lachnospiraceae bacterium]
MNTISKKLSFYKIFSLFLALFLSVTSVFPVFAAGEFPRLVDDADVLSDSEEAKLRGKLDEISERQQVDVVVVTVDSLEGVNIEDYADDFYDYYGYGFREMRDGILFLLSMEERDWNISTRGYAITVFTDAGLDYMSERIARDLKNEDYAAAFMTFADWCDDYIIQASTGVPYNIGNLPKEPFPFFLFFVICFAIAFVIALIVTGIMKRQLKSVRSRSEADNYVKSNSMQLTKKNDLFLYRHVEYREKKKDSDSNIA